MITSRRCVVRLKDLTPEESIDFFQTVCRVQRMSEKFYNTTASTVTVQDGEDAGQTVKHLHCHVMPRRKGDFEHNDEIYVKLNQHDLQGDESTPRRPIKEMIAEADLYRALLKTGKF